MRLNPFGEIVHREWFRTTGLRANIELREDEMVVMPDHVHGVMRIVGDHDPVGATRRVAPTGASGPAAGSVGAIIGQFKSVVAKQINTLRNTPGVPVWQRNYYEHVIRDDESLTRIRQYIVENPARWAVDRDNPAAVNPEPEEG